MTIEQEFYETFGVEPRYKFIRAERKEPCKEDCETYKKYYNSCYGCSMNFENISLEWLNKNYSKFEAKEKEDLYYPTITAEIREQLEEIILECEITNRLCLFKYKDGLSYYFWEDSNGEDAGISVSGKTRQEALLSLCIQLQPEIQEQVKELFNDK